MLAGNEVTSLFDIGDGVMLLEFHSKVNELDAPKFEILSEAIERLSRQRQRSGYCQ